MAIAPPVISLVDTTKVDTLEANIDALIGAVGWFAANVQTDGGGNVFWEGTSNTFLNAAERIVMRDRYLAVGWRIVQVTDPDGTKTKTRLRAYA